MQHPGQHLVLAIVVGLAACSGRISGDPGASPREPETGQEPPSGAGGAPATHGGGGQQPMGAGGAAGTPEPGMPGPLKLPAGGLRRLTAQQYANSVRDLLGAGITVPEVEPDPSSDDEFLLTSVAVAGVTSSARAVDQYDAAARSLAHQVFADAARRQQLVGCNPASATDSCARGFLAAFGRRVWRRPLTDEEVGRYAAAAAAVAQSRGNVWAGLETATTALFASPYFLYRVELGGRTAADGSRRLDDHELATRLSYTLADTAPDVALLDAAGKGDLTGKPEVLRATVERLLAAPAARPPLLTFFSEWLGTSGLDKNGLAKDTTLYPAATPALARGMYQEIEGLVTSLVFTKDADLLSLYETRETFLTTELAQLYGLPAGAVPAGAKASPVTLPEGPRAGFLTTGAFLSLNARATVTSPTLRGVFMRERLLCEHVPPPPPNVDTTLPAPPPGTVETMRERLTRHRTAPACESCHSFMDPLGLGLENFDALGAYRTMDAGKSIDATGDVDGKTFDGPQALQRLLREDPSATTCLIRQLVQQVTGTADEEAATSVAAALVPAWKSAGGRLRPFLQAYLTGELGSSVEATK